MCICVYLWACVYVCICVCVGVCVCVCVCVCVRERESHAASPRLTWYSRRKPLNIQPEVRTIVSSLEQGLTGAEENIYQETYNKTQHNKMVTNNFSKWALLYGTGYFFRKGNKYNL